MMQGAIKFYMDVLCVETMLLWVLEKNGFEFVKEEFGAEDDAYGNGMLIYRKEC